MRRVPNASTTGGPASLPEGDSAQAPASRQGGAMLIRAFYVSEIAPGVTDIDLTNRLPP